ncbi:MAG: hypothetical protein VST68_10710, partial [Nitrospirota bacterium]|nr:hypothetical protein [Nitrospirota bacterium]
MQQLLGSYWSNKFIAPLIIGTIFWGTLLAPLNAMTGVPAPEITNKTWLNAKPHRLADLRGQVVLVEFWTFGCYNCRNIEPYVK